MNGIDMGAKPSAEAPAVGTDAQSLLPRLGSDPGDLIDRIQKPRSLLPAFAQEIVAARGEAARLRSQNAKLQRRVLELETRFAVDRGLPSRDV